LNIQLNGLVAATHTPFDSDGNLRLSSIEPLAAHLLRNGVNAAFIGGTTGESHSLTVEERIRLAERWMDVAKGTKLQVIVHVGSNCLADAKTLAAQAGKLGAAATSALSPSYFKPKSVDALVSCCAEIAKAAPGLPFYYYDIPPLTGVTLSTADFLAKAGDRIPNLAGVKFSSPDLMAYQKCLHFANGRFDLPWGTDEYLLAALAVGATGGVGSSYNFAAPIYLRLMAAFERGDLATARIEQYRSVQLIDALAGFGYMAAAKALMGRLGIELGGPRLPVDSLGKEQHSQLMAKLDSIGAFEWIR
jgi:N-acetylneuraminate lyase